MKGTMNGTGSVTGDAVGTKAERGIGNQTGSQAAGQSPSWAWVPDPDSMPCPTCLISAVDVAAEHAQPGATADAAQEISTLLVEPATCPTCGHMSLEWGLAEEMDRVLREMIGIEQVIKSVHELERD